MNAFDADVLIYAADTGHPLGQRIVRLFPPEVNDGVETSDIGSILLVAELLLERAEADAGETDRLGLLLGRLDLRPVDRPIAGLAALVRSKYHLKTVDAIHLATAVHAGADRFITNNKRDFPKSITEIDITYPEDLPAP